MNIWFWFCWLDRFLRLYVKCTEYFLFSLELYARFVSWLISSLVFYSVLSFSVVWKGVSMFPSISPVHTIQYYSRTLEIMCLLLSNLHRKWHFTQTHTTTGGPLFTETNERMYAYRCWNMNMNMNTNKIKYKQRTHKWTERNNVVQYSLEHTFVVVAVVCRCRRLSFQKLNPNIICVWAYMCRRLRRLRSRRRCLSIL